MCVFRLGGTAEIGAEVDHGVGMPAKRAVELRGLARRVAASGVPMLVVENSVQIAEHAAGIGLLDAADVQAVRAAI